VNKIYKGVMKYFFIQMSYCESLCKVPTLVSISNGSRCKQWSL